MTDKQTGKALLVVDFQKDFCPPAGALKVTGGNQIVKPLNRAIKYFYENGLSIYLSRDWHPPVTKHFKEYGGIWPVHCVQNTPGANFHSELKYPGTAYIISKGMNPEEDAYSPLQGEAYGRSLDEILRAHKITDLYIGGLATDYCVKAACLDARKLGYTVYLLTDACRAVNLKPGDGALAVNEMLNAGVIETTTDEVLRGEA